MFQLGCVIKASSYILSQDIKLELYGTDIVGFSFQHCFDELKTCAEDILLIQRFHADLHAIRHSNFRVDDFCI